MTGVRRRPDGIHLLLFAEEAWLLRSLAVEVTTLLAPDEPASTDPLETLVGMSPGPTEPSDDPAVRRLLPDAYGDAAAAGEFRRLMDGELRRQKVAALEAVIAVVSDQVAAGVTTTLSDAEAEEWLQALNDIRLTIGSRLDIQDDRTEARESLDPSDPRVPLRLAYDWLTSLQQLLIDALDPPDD
jgi:hypothetical protein